MNGSLSREAGSCPNCLLTLAWCLCAELPALASSVGLTLLIPAREARSPTNTGLLAARCLTGSVVHRSGAIGEAIDYPGLWQASGTTVLLFPGPEAQPLTAALAAALVPPVRLLVVDGHWGQARRLQRKVLAAAPPAPGGGWLQVALTAPEPSRYLIRRRPKGLPQSLATMEAIAYALGVLDGPAVQQQLLDVFARKVARVLQSRGLRSTERDEVYRSLTARSDLCNPCSPCD